MVPRFTTKKAFYGIALLTLATAIHAIARQDHAARLEQTSLEEDTTVDERYIKKIIISGNTLVSEEAIRHRIPYQLGHHFDPTKTSTLIRNLHELGYFKQIEVSIEYSGIRGLYLYIDLTEKKRFQSARFVGNKHLLETAIRKKIDFTKIKTLEADELPKFEQIIRHMYAERGYHGAQVHAQLKETADGKVDVVFTINEGAYTVVKRVSFKGNQRINSKVLRNSIFTREDWLFSIMDRAGTYHPDAVEQDKYTIETMYHNQGFLTAKVVKTEIEKDQDRGDFLITFYIEEGPQYSFSEISAPGNELLNEEEILRVLPIRPGQTYSQDRLKRSIEFLRSLWGEHGYIYADVEPSVQPDEQTKTVKVALYSELGNKVRLNRINIVGNKKSRDKMIRRQIDLDEGEILNSRRMDRAKDRVSGLGYFDPRDGVNWKINRINDELCDLDLMVKEVRTGKFEFQLGTGGDAVNIRNAASAFTANATFFDNNAWGQGLQYNVNGSASWQRISGNASLMYPWLFDKPISGALAFGTSSQTYDEMRNNIQSKVTENRVGGTAGIGFFMGKRSDIHSQFQIGAEHLAYGNNMPQANTALGAEYAATFNAILQRRFEQGTMLWASNITNFDTRNHPTHPSRGHQWSLNFKVGIPTQSSGSTNDNTSYDCAKNAVGTNKNSIVGTNFGFLRFEGDASWYTPLIGEHDMVLGLHGHIGVVARLGNHTIPYRELFHVGGPASVRGFLFGQISPQWRVPGTYDSDSIGAKNAFWINTEIVVPLTPDFQYKAAVFYDGGAGWDTPDADLIPADQLRNNGFNYRHAIGFGVRILGGPFPAQIDWGLKLDRNKKAGEPLTEVHLTMNRTF
ncbi:outer membrane protein assembly factor BamA [Candidatus Babeliales bacterium]|nr:outer membrane protein assembly factor BamA [Candidatus Babeliales bacterium]